MRHLGGAIVVLLAGSLGGCALHSEKPLIATSAPVPEIAEGRYQIYGPFGPEQLAKVSAEQRGRCIDLGIRAVPPNASAPVGVIHCPFNETTLTPTNIAQLTRLADRFRMTGQNAEGKTEALEAWLTPLRAPYYLAQIHMPGGELKGYFYGIARPLAGRVHFFMVPCAVEGLKSVGKPDPKLACEVTSLAAIRADLLAETRRIDAGSADPPMVLAAPAAP